MVLVDAFRIVHTGSFSNQAAKQLNPGPILSRARASGIAVGKGVRNLALGLKSQRQPLCNTADGMRSCEDMIRFLTDLYAFLAGLAAKAWNMKGGRLTSTAKGPHHWSESFLEGMRYQMRRMIVNLVDRICPSSAPGRLKVHCSSSEILCGVSSPPLGHTSI